MAIDDNQDEESRHAVKRADCRVEGTVAVISFANPPVNSLAVYLTGYGFPRWRGGPMFYADLFGLQNVVRRMNEFAVNPYGDPGFWMPAPLILRLAESGATFDPAAADPD